MPIYGLHFLSIPANIYTFITHAIAQAFNFDTLLTYGLSLPGFIFSNHIPISCTSTIAIHKPNFFLIYGIQIPT